MNKSYMIKLKKGDLVLITTGKDRGKQVKIERLFPKKGTVLLPGLNQYKKHRKSQGQDRPGEILTISRPLAISKVALLCPKCKQQTRVGWRNLDDKKLRFCRKCEQNI
jgi:large subunit ribosomal protein L24